MRKRGKKFAAARAQVAVDRSYTIEEAIPLVQKVKFAKFGKTKRVLAIAGGEKQKEAQEAGADVVGGEEFVEKIQGGWMDFDAVVATPDMMRAVGKLGKVLGPRGLMPNPKTGTVSVDIGKAIKEIKAGKVEFRVDKTGIIHAPVVKAKPAAAKGKYLKSVTLSSTMGPGVRIDTTHIIDVLVKH